MGFSGQGLRARSRPECTHPTLAALPSHPAASALLPGFCHTLARCPQLCWASSPWWDTQGHYPPRALSACSLEFKPGPLPEGGRARGETQRGVEEREPQGTSGAPCRASPCSPQMVPDLLTLSLWAVRARLGEREEGLALHVLTFSTVRNLTSV